jgi:cytochrome c biogenesis protein CcmG, thiol:disulfide interchange protein DsbE
MRQIAWLMAAVAMPAAIALAGPEIKLEGSGDRQRLDAMCFKPFDPSLLGKLSEWTGGDALTADSMKGRPVMFVTWSSWYKTSHEALRLAQSLHSKYGGDGSGGGGLIVVGVHHKEGWPKAAEVAHAAGVEFRTALDAAGEFRKGLFTNQDPDFYFVDRAGRLRFADVQTSSAEAAAEMLTGESTEQASAAAPPAAPAAKDPAGENPGSAKFAAPSADEYKAAAWPKKNGRVGPAKDFQGKPMPKPLGKEQKYLDGKTPDRTGKVTVVDFWATWCPPCRAAMPIFDEVQTAHKDDAVVIGISDESESKVRSFIKQNPHEYPQAVDTSGGAKRALGIQGIPHVVVLSSDGVIRWQGNPHDPTFKTVVKDVIEADPGVKARRKAAGG